MVKKIRNYLFLAAIVAGGAYLGACGDDEGPLLGVLGEACEEDLECGMHYVDTNENQLDCRKHLNPHFTSHAPQYPLKDGMCTLECEWNHDADSINDFVQGTCGEGGECLAYGGGDQVCFESCKTNEDCVRDGYTCFCVDYDQRCAEEIGVRACIPLRESFAPQEIPRTYRKF